MKTNAYVLMPLLLLAVAYHSSSFASAQSPTYPFDPYPLSPPWQADVEGTDFRVYHEAQELPNSSNYSSQIYQIYHPLGWAGTVEVRLYQGDGVLAAIRTQQSSNASFFARF